MEAAQSNKDAIKAMQNGLHHLSVEQDGIHRADEEVSDEPTLNAEEANGPFEGPEKLLELWFTDCAEHAKGRGLREICRADWESMLDEVHCKVLSVIEGDGVDAYLLSESSMFVWPHKLILKTCGTTTLLLGLQTILNLAAKAGFNKGVWRAFYSRKTFMFPDRQKGPHKDWREEMKVLDSFFENGSGYTVGPMNGDHWLLYSTEANDSVLKHGPSSEPSLPVASTSSASAKRVRLSPPDQTLEILMSDLHPSSCSSFFFPTSADSHDPSSGQSAGLACSDSTGITALFPPSTSQTRTTLDAYCFQPCGYSANVTMQNDRYATIHVTPEEEWSYASFETNMEFGLTAHDGNKLNVSEVVRRLLKVFNPGRFTLTLFVSSGDDEVETSGEQGLAALHEAKFLTDSYKRTAKIVYDFSGDYELLFSQFIKR